MEIKKAAAENPTTVEAPESFWHSLKSKLSLHKLSVQIRMNPDSCKNILFN